MANTYFTTPVGRLVAGNLYKANDKDADGKPLLIKSGANAGKPRVDYSFGLAIPKGTERSWAETEWGAVIYRTGMADFPQQSQSPHFAWKVTDGDSTIPNKRGKKPCDREGYPGHWVLFFSSSFAPKVYGEAGTVLYPEPDRVKPGHFVQVYGSVGGNGSKESPGVFLNHSMVCFIDFGPEIIVGADPTAVGFGAQRAPMTGAAAPSFGGHAPSVLPGTVPAPALPGVPTQTPAPTAPVPTVPNPAMLNIPGTPPAPVAPPPAPVKKMTALAQGIAYEAYIAGGWTDAQLIQHGYMEP